MSKKMDEKHLIQNRIISQEIVEYIGSKLEEKIDF